MNSRVRSEEELQLTGVGSRKRRQARGVELGRDVQRRVSGVGHDAIVQSLAPELLEITVGIRGFQPITHCIVAAQTGLVAEGSEHLVGRMCAVQRSDQRLDDTDSPIERARITPGFEVMRFRHVPQAILGRLVEMRTQMYRVRDFANLGREIEIVRCVINGIAAKDQQRRDLAGFNIRAEVPQGLDVIHRARFHRLGVVHSVADVAKRGIDGVRQGVHFGRLLFARDYQRAAMIFLQIPHNNVEPFLCARRKCPASAQT